MIPQIPKLTGGKDVATWAAQVVDTLNPVLRSVLLAGGYRWSEVDGVNGAAPTFTLQVAQRGGTWATVASFDSTGQIVQPAWVAPALLNSWANFGAGRIAAGYIKDSLGWVHLRGSVTNAPGTAANANLFLLPTGFRPSATLALSGQDVTAAAGAYRRIEIDSSGNVSPPVLVAAGSIFSLDGISFDGRT